MNAFDIFIWDMWYNLTYRELDLIEFTHFLNFNYRSVCLQYLVVVLEKILMGIDFTIHFDRKIRC